MKGLKIVTVLVTASLITTTACTERNGSPGRGIENGGALNKTDVGTAAGVVAGGLVGSTIGAGAGQALAVVGGALLGGVLGEMIGHSLDNADRQAYDQAAQRAMNSGSSRSWSNPDTGHHGTIRPHKHFTNEDGQYCRKYTQTIYIDGQKHIGHGTACREEDGSWKVAE